MSASWSVPEGLLTRLRDQPAEGGPGGLTWLRALPRLADEVLDRWNLEVVGAAMNGHTALVLPVARDGVRLICKIGWPHAGSDQEHLALRHWAGVGAVRLVAADPGRGALLLEELDAARDLGQMWIDDALTIVGVLLARLHVPAPPTVRRLSDLAAGWAESLRGLDGGLPPRLVVRALGLIADLVADPACDARLLHTDLHFGNVLAGQREPWLVIDPKPMAGHPGLELHPVLRNRVEELGTGSALRWSVRRRVEIVCPELLSW
jgi:streptomycin 6-kinase